MSDLISRQAAMDAFLADLTKREEKNLLHTWSTVEVEYYISKILEQQPTIDVEPVRHGHWYDEPDYLGTGRVMYFCSYCGSASWREDPYCWHCGSKMDVSDTNVGKMEVMK